MGNNKSLGGAEMIEMPTKPKPKKRRAKPHVGSKARISYPKIAEVVVLLVTGELSLDEISLQTKIGKTTVQRIRNSIPADVFTQFGPNENNEIQDLITTQIKENLLATQRIVQVTQDEVWIKAQRAPELGTFYGIITDKTIRILDAIERANERERIEAYSNRARLGEATEEIAQHFIQQRT